MAEEASGSSRRPRPRRRRRPAPWGKAAAASAALAALIVVSALVEEVGLISLGILEKPFCFDCKSRMSMRARHQWFIHASSPIPAGDRPPGSRTLVILEGQVSVQACLHSFEEKPSLFSLPPILQNSIRHMFSVQKCNFFSFFTFSRALDRSSVRQRRSDFDQDSSFDPEYSSSFRLLPGGGGEDMLFRSDPGMLGFRFRGRRDLARLIEQ